VLKQHRAMLDNYLAGLDVVEPTPTLEGRRRPKPNRKRV